MVINAIKKKKKIEVSFFEGPEKGIGRFNPFALKNKIKVFSTEKEAKMFAKKINKKKNSFVNSLARKR